MWCVVIASLAQVEPAWRKLAVVSPSGHKEGTGSYVVDDRASVRWTRPPVVDDAHVATGRKSANVALVIYNPVLEIVGGKTLIQHLNAHDPVEYSHILASVIREASWGYVNYEITDVIEIDGYPIKVDGFRYDDASFLEVRRTQDWQPATISYRRVLEENHLLERVQRGTLHEVWLWGAGGMHFDEFAMYIPNRYARFGPTDNPWLYRPYDIPAECGRTLWMMGFNYEVGADNMIHSYTHRVESMAALQFGEGIWDPKTRRDAWNVFSWLEMDHPGTPSQVGNCHVPPNGQAGYDYNNPRRVLSLADAWARYPDLGGKPRMISSDEWGNSQFGYQKWILEHLPKFEGATNEGLNNWWVYVANTDEDLPDYRPPARDQLLLPSAFASPNR
ncbi:MAG: hypothetical protein U1E76_14905 [Planctomycetota bacterium]